MITGFAVRNFKSLSQIPEHDGELIPFGPLNVLIGPNGCGKSSLLQAIDFLRAFFESSVEVYLKDRHWEYKDLPNLRQTSKAIRWEVSARLDANNEGRGAGDYHYTVALQPRKHLGVSEETLVWRPAHDPEKSMTLISRHGRKCAHFDTQNQKLRHEMAVGLPASLMSTWNSSRDRAQYAEALHFRDWVSRFQSFLIWDPKVLRTPSRGEYDELGQSGENLASVVGHLRDTSRPAFDRLVKRIKHLFPTISDVSVSGRGWGWRSLNLHEANGKTIVFNSRQISDGVLRLLAVTSLLYLDRIPTVITFEEPENGVHPQLISEVVKILQELTQRKPPNRCQVFMTTHSPYVLDEFYDHPERVYCMERPGPQAGAKIFRLRDARQLKTADEAFGRSLGEAWFSGLIGATAGKGTE